jgi:hypothetical protein
MSPYMWMCSGPMSTTPLDGEGIEAMIGIAGFCPRRRTSATENPML